MPSQARARAEQRVAQAEQQSEAKDAEIARLEEGLSKAEARHQTDAVRPRST